MPQHIASLPELLRSRPAFVGWSELTDPMLVGLMAQAGFHAVILDQQHGLHNSDTCFACIVEAALTGTPVIVRVPVGDFAEAARMLDRGAAGVIAPMINTAAEAAQFVSFVKYPPLGQRSFGPGRALQFSSAATEDAYLATANAASLAIVMCETRPALDALDEILAVPGVDGVLAGPGDLAVALSGGRSADSSAAPVHSAMVRIAQRARAAGKFACAFAGNAARARELVQAGYHLVTVGYDGGLIADAFAQALAAASS